MSEASSHQAEGVSFNGPLHSFITSGEVLFTLSGAEDTMRSILLTSIAEGLSEHDVVEAPVWFGETVKEAKRFVAELTGFDEAKLPHVYMVPADSRFLQHEVEIQGAYSAIRHQAFIREVSVGSASDSVEALIVGRNVAHELAHSAVDRNLQGLTVVSKEVGENQGGTFAGGYYWQQSFYAHDGHQKVQVRKEVVPNSEKSLEFTELGSFFAEGWAEEVGIRFAEQHSRVPEDVEAVAAQEGESAAVRYLQPQLDEDGDLVVTAPAMAALGLDLLEAARLIVRPDGYSIFALLTAMRHEDTNAAAQKEFIQTLNTIQPGLYQQLRQLKYNGDEFMRGVQLIDAALAKVEDLPAHTS